MIAKRGKPRQGRKLSTSSRCLEDFFFFKKLGLCVPTRARSLPLDKRKTLRRHGRQDSLGLRFVHLVTPHCILNVSGACVHWVLQDRLVNETIEVAVLQTDQCRKLSMKGVQTCNTSGLYSKLCRMRSRTTKQTAVGIWNHLSDRDLRRVLPYSILIWLALPPASS